MPVFVYDVTVEFPMVVEADSREEADELAKVHAPGDFRDWCLEDIMAPPVFRNIVKRHDDIPEDLEDAEPWGQEGRRRSLQEMFPRTD
jgi:hypothetical protein